jgi:hypothetical protein
MRFVMEKVLQRAPVSIRKRNIVSIGREVLSVIAPSSRVPLVVERFFVAGHRRRPRRCSARGEVTLQRGSAGPFGCRCFLHGVRLVFALKRFVDGLVGKLKVTALARLQARVSSRTT